MSKNERYCFDNAFDAPSISNTPLFYLKAKG